MLRCFHGAAPGVGDALFHDVVRNLAGYLLQQQAQTAAAPVVGRRDVFYTIRARRELVAFFKTRPRLVVGEKKR